MCSQDPVATLLCINKMEKSGKVFGVVIIKEVLDIKYQIHVKKKRGFQYFKIQIPNNVKKMRGFQYFEIQICIHLIPNVAQDTLTQQILILMTIKFFINHEETGKYYNILSRIRKEEDSY